MSEQSHSDLPSPKLPWNVYGYSAVASFSSFVYGYNTGLISPAIIFIPESIHLSIFETGAIVSTILLGAIIGSFFSGLLADLMGRRRVLAWNNLVMVGAAITASVSDSSNWLIASRFILGTGVGIASVVPSLYITEVAPTHVRGKLGAFNQLNGWTGVIISYFVGYEITNCTAGDMCWRYMFASGAVLCIFHLILALVFLPETPQWLVSQGRSHEAISVLTRIYGDAHEIHIIRQYQLLSERKEYEEPLCFDPYEIANNKKVLSISIILQFLQQLSGTSIVLYYTNYVFRFYGYSSGEALLYNAIACIPQFTVLVAVVFLLDRSGRKPALQISELGVMLSLLLIGFASQSNDIQSQLWLLLTGIILHRAAFAGGMGPVPIVLVSELLPFAIRGRGLALCQGLNWSTNFIVTILFPQFFAEYNASYIYWSFAGFSLVGFLFISIFVPETKCIPLEKIEEQHGNLGDTLRSDNLT